MSRTARDTVERVVNGTRPAGDEPVLLSLTTPSRRDLVTGLTRPVGATEATVPRLNADLPDPDVADFLAGIAHTDSGFVARTDDGERAVAILAATAAALCGEDIRAALAAPDRAFLRGLKPAAVEAIREVLHAVETDRPDLVDAALAGLAPG